MKTQIQAILQSGQTPEKKLSEIEKELAKWQTQDEVVEFIEPLSTHKADPDYPGQQVNRDTAHGKQVYLLRYRRFPYKPSRLLELGQSLKQVNELSVMFRREDDLPEGAKVSFMFGKLKKTGTVVRKIDHRYVVLSEDTECIVPKHEISQV